MRLLIAMAATLMLTLALIGPVAAADRGGCSSFGAATVEGARAGGFGPFVAGYASSAPGVLSGIVASEHADMCIAP